MKVFISWSGDRSKHRAMALRKFLEDVNHRIEPWMSEADIKPGARWGAELANELEKTSFGVVCVTKEALDSDWVLFEAGALSKSVNEGRVCPLLFGVRKADLKGPLSQFQCKEYSEEAIWDFLKTLNESMAEQGLEQQRLRRYHERDWPDFRDAISRMEKEEAIIASRQRVSLAWDVLGAKVIIEPGDLFESDGHLTITADEYFLAKPGKLVNERSLIGQLVTKVYGGDAQLLDTDLNRTLADTARADSVEKPIEGKTKRYPIGTTVTVHHDERTIFVTALCRIDPDSKHGRATTKDVLAALSGLWEALANNPTGRRVAVPLIGAGQSGVGLSYMACLNILLASLMVAVRSRAIQDEISIVVPSWALSSVNLNAIQAAWAGRAMP